MERSTATQLARQSPHPFAPSFLIECEPGYRIFFRNLFDVLFPRPILQVRAPEAATLWCDVFVPTKLPWSRLAGSFALHVAVIAGVWGASRALLLRPHAVPPPVFSHRDVIYFSPSEYLPPLDTGNTLARAPQKGDPEFARQPIRSIPPESDNRTQTIVTPPDIKLTHDVPAPNMVAWNSALPSIPLRATSSLQRNMARENTPVIAPPPLVEQAVERRRMNAPYVAIVAPAPDISVAVSRQVVSTPSAIIEPPPVVNGQVHRVGQINIGHFEVVAPAPALPIGEQRALAAGQIADKNVGVIPPAPSGRGLSRTARSMHPVSDVVPPPPAIAGASGSARIIALGIHPAAAAPPLGAGNRRGTFSATPEGKPAASGTPEIAPQHGLMEHRGGGSGGSRPATNGLPPGIVVGAVPNTTSEPIAGTRGSSSDRLLANAKPANRVAPSHPAATSDSPSSEVEREVFHDRKIYSMLLNMPNLNSAGGSWVIRFAELKGEGDGAGLIAPEATRKVDPAYPLELMRTRVEGTVTLYAVIHSDGSVGDVRVLNSVNERLDQYASAALYRWHFRPASRNGAAVPVEAVVMIPFRTHRTF